MIRTANSLIRLTIIWNWHKLRNLRRWARNSAEQFLNLRKICYHVKIWACSRSLFLQRVEKDKENRIVCNKDSIVGKANHWEITRCQVLGKRLSYLKQWSWIRIRSSFLIWYLNLGMLFVARKRVKAKSFKTEQSRTPLKSILPKKANRHILFLTRK